MPKRIVSLVPSATEMICALGLRDCLVGVTHECDFPASVQSIPKVTRSFIPKDASSAQIDAMVRESARSSQALYSLDREALVALQPDLVVTQSLCDVCAVDEVEVERALGNLPADPSIVRLEPTRFADLFDGLRMIGEAAGVEDRAENVIAELSERVVAVQGRAQSSRTQPRAMILEWIDPPFCAGHWNPELVQLAGGIECVGQVGERSRAISWESILRVNPDVLVIACCGYTIERAKLDLPILIQKPGFAELACVRGNEVHVLDGNSYLNRPGPRLVDSLEILFDILHPDVSCIST